VLSDASNINSGSFNRIQLMKAKKNKPGKDTAGKDSGTYGYGNGGYGNGGGTGCLPGVPMVRCTADPCAVTPCPAYPKANCTANYCGGCYAIFTKNDHPVDCGTSGISCPPGQPLVECTANPCTTTTCSSCPNAHCTANYCGGCHAIFSDDNGVLNCSDDTYACSVTTSGVGDPCGGNIMNPPQCASGLVCTPVPGSGPFGDVGGVCKAPVVCTQEAKLCPNGAYVGRNPDNGCEFFPCPPNQDCDKDAFRCPDGSIVGRDPNQNCDFICPGSSYSNVKQGKGKDIGSAP